MVWWYWFVIGIGWYPSLKYWTESGSENIAAGQLYCFDFAEKRNGNPASMTFPLFPPSASCSSWTTSLHPYNHTGHLFHVWTCLMYKSCCRLLPVSTSQHNWLESQDIFQRFMSKWDTKPQAVDLRVSPAESLPSWRPRSLVRHGATCFHSNKTRLPSQHFFKFIISSF